MSKEVDFEDGFHKIEKGDGNLLNYVKDLLIRRTCIYGNQQETLRKLENGIDRNCEVLIEEASPRSLLIYKLTPISLVEFNMTNSFEIKTLFPIDRMKTFEYLKETLKRATEIAQSVGAKSVHMTVSEKELTVLDFLLNNNFDILTTWIGKYMPAVKEHLIYKPINYHDDELEIIEKLVKTEAELLKEMAQADAKSAELKIKTCAEPEELEAQADPVIDAEAINVEKHSEPVKADADPAVKKAVETQKVIESKKKVKSRKNPKARNPKGKKIGRRSEQHWKQTTLFQHAQICTKVNPVTSVESKDFYMDSAVKPDSVFSSDAKVPMNIPSDHFRGSQCSTDEDSIPGIYEQSSVTVLSYQSGDFYIPRSVDKEPVMSGSYGQSSATVQSDEHGDLFRQGSMNVPSSRVRDSFTQCCLDEEEAMLDSYAQSSANIPNDRFRDCCVQCSLDKEDPVTDSYVQSSVNVSNDELNEFYNQSSVKTYSILNNYIPSSVNGIATSCDGLKNSYDMMNSVPVPNNGPRRRLDDYECFSSKRQKCGNDLFNQSQLSAVNTRVKLNTRLKTIPSYKVEKQRIKKEKEFDSCSLKRKYVYMIRDGLKTVEGRLATKMFARWREGQVVRFHYRQPKDDVFVKITQINHYKTFRQMLMEEGVANCIPDVQSVEMGESIYYSIPKYKEKEKQFGVIGFRMTLLNGLKQ